MDHSVFIFADGLAPMDDVYAIDVAKSNYREGFNTSDVERVLSVFAPEFTDMSDSRPTRYRADAAAKLRRSLAQLFAEHEAKLNVIINAHLGVR